ncbi:MAG TPA: IclR family transcriptional regulator [Amycolatopsis sp.]|nr:IclR family transcriptional regulator [Amycolatopsis sp.]
MLDRVTRILDAFSGKRMMLSLSDLARSANLPLSTVHRLVRELVEWGGLERTTDGTYTVGAHLWEIAVRASRTQRLRDIAMPSILELLETTRQHVQLAVLSDDDALLIEKISSQHAVETIGRVGGRLPLHASAAGKALLAYATNEYQTSILSGRLASYTSHTLTTPQALSGDLASIRDRGFALSTEELSIGAVSCAAAVTTRGQEAIAAISVVMPTKAGPPRVWAQAVMKASQDIERALARPAKVAPLSAQLTGRRHP